MDELVCRLDALSETERARRAELFSRLGASVTGVSELPEGYQLLADSTRFSRGELDEFVALEGRCCSFLRFNISEAPQQVIVKITGGEGVKEFLKSELGVG